MAPEWARLPLVFIATAATIIASQAVISGAFSVTHQAVQLGFLPRLRTQHTSARAAGQIYIPAVNWALLVMVVLLVLGFRQSTNLASAYGIAVTGTMFITTCMLAVVLFSGVEVEPVAGGAGARPLPRSSTAPTSRRTSPRSPTAAGSRCWSAAVIFTVLTTWATGRRLMRERLSEGGDAARRSSSSRPPSSATACAAPRSSCPPRRTASRPRCCTTSSTTRCCTSAC